MGGWRCPGLPNQGCKAPTLDPGGQNIPEEWGWSWEQALSALMSHPAAPQACKDKMELAGEELASPCPLLWGAGEEASPAHQPRETSGRGCGLRKMSDIPHPPHDWLLIYTPALGPFLTFLQIALMSLLLSNAAPIFRGFALAFLGCTVPARDLLSSKANYLLRFLLLSLFINSWFLSQKWAHLGC